MHPAKLLVAGEGLEAVSDRRVEDGHGGDDRGRLVTLGWQGELRDLLSQELGV